jgi:signal peptide peptidase SppA
MKILDYYGSRPWAMDETAYRGLMRSMAALDTQTIASRLPQNAQSLPAAVKAAPKSGGVAVIPITGPIFKDATLLNRFMTEVFGGSITEEIAAQFSAAMNDPEVGSILFKVDSPGGEAYGLDTVSEQIFQARGKGKPIVAHVDGLNASAAYYLSSAADAIISTKDGTHGSIGTIFNWLNFDKMMAELGIEEVTIVSEGSELKALDEMTPEGRAQMQEWANALGNNFVEAVARNRGVSAGAVRQDFGQGWVKFGKDAQKAGLIDGIASFDKTLNQLASGKFKIPTQQKTTGAPRANGGKGMTVAEFLKSPLSALLGNPDGRHESGEEEVPFAPAPALASAPAQVLAAGAQLGVVRIAGMTEEEVLDMKAKLEAQENVVAEAAAALAQSQENRAAAFAATYASAYLENGDGEEESDRSKFIAAATALHLKAQRGEAATTDELAALCSIQQSGAVVDTGVLGEAELEGATAHVTEPEKPKNEGAGVKAVREGQRSVIESIKNGKLPTEENRYARN